MPSNIFFITCGRNCVNFIRRPRRKISFSKNNLDTTYMKIEVILTPKELPALAKRNLGETVCVVFDVLRATSALVTALHNGAKAILPVAEISEALAFRQTQPGVLLGGERGGVRISANGVVFDLGNSPREYTPEKVRGQTIVSTTTNGTRALRACAGAKTVLAASFLNLTATAKFLRQKNFAEILLVCAGTHAAAALEDALAAGALCELLAENPAAGTLSDSAEIVRCAYEQAKSNLAEVARRSENARRLLAIPELRGDVAFCLQRDIYSLVAEMGVDGVIRSAPLIQ
jgi:2-phosphosulfolactate phosphatase